MRELKVIDVDHSTLIVAHPDGEEFRVPIDASTMTRLRGARTEAVAVRVSPKDVQAHIRAGMSAAEVSELTGASLDFIARFEGPVLAEREFIINSALAIQTQASVDLETGDTSSAFGALINSRLRELGASGERWASWKEADGTWVVKLEFEAATIDHDARWSFEPRKHALSPLNSDASTLSQKGDLTSGIIPRLRAVPGQTGDVSPDVVGAAAPQNNVLATVSHLEFATPPQEANFHEASGHLANSIESTSSASVADEFTYETNVFVGMADLFSTTDVNVRAPDTSDNQTGTSPTADLLEALRRRRGERETTPAWLRDENASREVARNGTAEIPEQSFASPANTTSSVTGPQPFFPQLPVTPPVSAKAETRDGTGRTGSHAKRERTSMPSWDEIVFGTRAEEDPQ